MLEHIVLSHAVGAPLTPGLPALAATLTPGCCLNILQIPLHVAELLMVLKVGVDDLFLLLLELTAIKLTSILLFSRRICLCFSFYCFSNFPYRCLYFVGSLFSTFGFTDISLFIINHKL